MLFMILVKASTNSENDNRPRPDLQEAMDQYNDALIEAGVRVMAMGLHPSSEGLRLAYPQHNEKPVVIEGPLRNPSDVVAGFFLINVKSKEEAIEWAMKVPDPQGFGEGQIELRQVFE